MTSFEHMVKQLTRVDAGLISVKNIPRDEYEIFCKEYMFDKLKDVSFGTAFCKRFEVTDFVLDLLQSENSAKKHIEYIGYIK
jgi:hypothetical protein